jgi:hypothetical protein
MRDNPMWLPNGFYELLPNLYVVGTLVTAALPTASWMHCGQPKRFRKTSRPRSLAANSCGNLDERVISILWNFIEDGLITHAINKIVASAGISSGVARLMLDSSQKG